MGDGDAGNVATGSLDDSGTKPGDEEKTGSTESNSNPGASNPTTSSNQSNSENNDSSSNDVESASVAQYSLTLICNYGSPGTYWASQADYLAGLLSINYQLSNSGPDAAHNLHVTSATANNGVTIVSPLPALGTLGVGDSTIFILRWHVPADVNRFTTQLTICASCDKKDDEDNENDDPNNNLNDDPGNKPDDQPGDTLAVNDPADQGGTLASSLSLSAAADRTSLPSTGFSLLTAILIALVIAPIGAVLLSLSKTIGKLIRVRQK